MDGRFLAQVVAAFVFTLIAVFTVMSDSLQATMATAFKSLKPEVLTSEQILDRQRELRLKLKNAYIDLGSFWREGDTIQPNSFMLGSSKSTWNPPFFMPVPETVMAKIAEEDVDPVRFKERQRYIEAAVELGEDRCNAKLRKELMLSYAAYARGYVRSINNDSIYYYATLEDKYIVGLHITLLADGYLTLADFKRKKVQSRFIKTSYFHSRFDDPDTRLQERRRCPSNAS